MRTNSKGLPLWREQEGVRGWSRGSRRRGVGGGASPGVSGHSAWGREAKADLRAQGLYITRSVSKSGTTRDRDAEAQCLKPLNTHTAISEPLLGPRLHRRQDVTVNKGQRLVGHDTTRSKHPSQQRRRAALLSPEPKGAQSITDVASGVQWTGGGELPEAPRVDWSQAHFSTDM